GAPGPAAASCCLPGSTSMLTHPLPGHPRGRTRTSRSELLPSQVSQGNNGVFPGAPGPAAASCCLPGSTSMLTHPLPGHPRGRTRTSRSELLPSQVSQGNNGVFP
ncbi:hypothetical protein Q8A73_024344, partial [Channa argus]